MADDAREGPSVAENPAKQPSTYSKKQRRGILSRIWTGIFSGKEDFEKRLKDLSKEEASIHTRMKRRAQSWRKTARNIIVSSVILEVVAVAYAIMNTRSLDLNWQMRAARVLPMFVLPGLSSVIYSALKSFTRMRDSMDQKTLESLRSERQAKIDELKERTNYYSTQQLIQRYDLDPAAKAAAASVLASKLGLDSGLQVYLGDETKLNAPLGKSNDVELVYSDGLRYRNQSHARSRSQDAGAMRQLVDEISYEFEPDSEEVPVQNQREIDHRRSLGTTDGGWIARIAAMLVGEDPAQCYALICKNCHIHNGLARKEDFPYITYYCPNCHTLNGSQQPGEHDLSFGSDMGSCSDSKASPLAPGYGKIARNASNASSVTEGEVMSNLATVKEELMEAIDGIEEPGVVAAN